MIRMANETTRKRLQELYDEMTSKENINEEDYYDYCDDYYNDICRISYFLEQKDISSLFEVIIDGQVVDYISTYEVMGIKVISPFELYKDEKKVYDDIRNFFKENILISTQYINLSKLNFFETTNVSSFDSEYEYNFEKYYVINKEEITLMRDAFEKRFPKLGDISFEVMEGDSINEYLYDKEFSNYPLWKDNCNISNIAGFRYLTPENLDNQKILVAKTNGAIIGVIKWWLYHKENPSYAHYGLNYIDVAMPYRRKGIAKLMISELKKHIKKDRPFVLSRESDMGHKCHMEISFKNVFHDDVYTYKEWEDYQYSLLLSKSKQ